MSTMGYSSNVAVSYDINFHRYLHIGERAKHYTSIVNISDRKTTALGEGFFVTEQVEYLTVDEKPFADALITYFQYQAAEEKAEENTHRHSKQMEAGSPLIKGLSSEQTDYTDIEISALHVGDSITKGCYPHYPQAHRRWSTSNTRFYSRASQCGHSTGCGNARHFHEYSDDQRTGCSLSG